jgi:hypothetical protein
MSAFEEEIIPSDEHNPSLCEPKINECKDLDNTFLKKYDVKRCKMGVLNEKRRKYALL